MGTQLNCSSSRDSTRCRHDAILQADRNRQRATFHGPLRSIVIICSALKSRIVL
jgi:hypothetical protein